MNVRKRVLALFVTLAAMVVVVLGASAPASATATGCARWGAKQIAGVSIPTGQYCFKVAGSGTHVDWTSGSFDTYQIGYPTEVVRFYDTNGNNYQSFTTYSASGNQYSYHYWQTGINGNARTGSVCGTLLSYGQEVVRVCENIYP